MINWPCCYAILLAVFVSACSNQVAQSSVDDSGSTMEKNASMTPQLEALKNPRVQGDSLVFSVVSHGCTKSSSFSVRHTVTDGQCHVEIIRDVRDMCKRAAELKAIKLEWTAASECEGLPVVFKNPSLEY